MKDKTSAARRRYRQTARASAAEATGKRILESALRRMQEQWFEEVTLDAVAEEAGVTVQTVIRRFRNKDQLLEAAAEQLDKEILGRRTVAEGEVVGAIDVLAADYEAVGDLVWRLLAQEERYPVLHAVCDGGRRSHRAWVANVFRPWLDGRDSKAAGQRLDALVAATDLCVWKLMRRDLGRSVRAYKSMVSTLIAGVLPTSADRQRSAGGAPRKENKEQR